MLQKEYQMLPLTENAFLPDEFKELSFSLWHYCCNFIPFLQLTNIVHNAVRNTSFNSSNNVNLKNYI